MCGTPLYWRAFSFGVVLDTKESSLINEWNKPGDCKLCKYCVVSPSIVVVVVVVVSMHNDQKFHIAKHFSSTRK